MMLQQPAEESPEPSVRRWLGRVATLSRLGLALHDGRGTGVATGRHSGVPADFARDRRDRDEHAILRREWPAAVHASRLSCSTLRHKSTGLAWNKRQRERSDRRRLLHAR